MNKIILSSVAIVTSFAIGVFVGPRIVAQTAQPVAIYQEAAVNVANALQDEKFLQELAAFSKESKSSIKKCIFSVFKTLQLPVKNLSEMKEIVAGYQELNDMFDEVNIELVQEAWQCVAWEIIDGQIFINPSSLNASARKLAGQDPVIAPRLKKFAALNTQWGDAISTTIQTMNEQIDQKVGDLFFPFANFHAALFKTLRKYPHVQELIYQVHACLQWQHTKQLFLLALKDELINRMPAWLPQTWPYAKSGLEELGELLDGLITKQIKYAEKLAQKTESDSAQDNAELEE